ncbi:MAG: hypothetical protein U1F17_16210 [Burkholderiaceae bacterium]
MLVAPDHREDLVGHLVVQRIERLGPAQRDHLHPVDVVDQHVALEALVVGERALRHRHAGALASEALEDARGLGFAERAHQLERAALEAERDLAAQVEVGRLADPAIEDVHRLREQHPEQALAHRGRRVGATSSRWFGLVVIQFSTERKIGAGR